MPDRFTSENVDRSPAPFSLELLQGFDTRTPQGMAEYLIGIFIINTWGGQHHEDLASGLPYVDQKPIWRAKDRMIQQNLQIAAQLLGNRSITCTLLNSENKAIRCPGKQELSDMETITGFPMVTSDPERDPLMRPGYPERLRLYRDPNYTLGGEHWDVTMVNELSVPLVDVTIGEGGPHESVLHRLRESLGHIGAMYPGGSMPHSS